MQQTENFYIFLKDSFGSFKMNRQIFNTFEKILYWPSFCYLILKSITFRALLLKDLKDSADFFEFKEWFMC